MLPRSIEIGPLTIHLYGLIIALAIFIGWYIAKKRAHLHKIPQDLFDDPILLLPLVLGVIGARAYHVADYWDIYSRDLLSIFAIQNGGLGIWGSLIGIFLGFWLVAKVKRIDLLTLLDLASPSLILGQAIGRIGNYINQEAFGPPTNLPWGVFISPENRPAQFATSTHFHPTFFYEAVIDLIFFAVLIYLSKKLNVKGLPRQNSHLEPSTNSSQKAKGKNRRGQMFALYLILYSLGRFIVEFWRIDTWVIGTVKIAHVVSIAAFLAGIWLFTFQKKGLDTR